MKLAPTRTGLDWRVRTALGSRCEEEDIDG